ncbi:cell division protein FtsQ/DivIB [Enterococcus aquimarinus]|uniref:Cell division protein DivIB n=1 Tax=Enterococcus aquimarinus TaxID=328396 RepID=A0A1L8QRW4_9ENTE|nr:cell division protein FtsQ/DivIB [Enterococcus aquimarinus]OJG10251.1 cell division protein FtsQ [Enterococcus aquimarinus]
MKDKEKNSSSTEEHDALTPWQKEHLLYLESQGIDPKIAEEPETEILLDKTLDSFEEEALDASNEKDEGNSQSTIDKPFSFSDHLPNFKAYRDKKLRKRLLILVVIFLVPLLGSLYYISPLSKVSAVVVAENPLTPKEALIESSQIVKNERLWPQFFARQRIATAIEKANPRVKKATITLQQWNQLHLHVEEYSESAYLVKGNDYLPILENGTILQEPQKEVTKGRVIVENFTDETLILETLKQYKELPKEIQDAISQITYAPSKNNEELLTIFMNDGNQVIVGISKLADHMKYYLQVAKEMSEKGVIDMEVGIYSYPYPSNETEKEENTESSESF